MTSTRTIQRPTTHITVGPPEWRTGLQRITFGADGTEVVMQPGPWCALPDGRGSAGAIGVLVDNVLGYESERWDSPPAWIVTREIRVDYLAPMPTAGGMIVCRGAAPEPMGRAGYGRGVIADPSGAILAHVSDWVRYGTPAPDALSDSADEPEIPDLLFADLQATLPGVPPAPADALEACGGLWLPEEGDLVLTVEPGTANLSGNLHGGVCFAAAVLRAELELTALRPQARVTSAHVVHVASGLPDSRIHFTVEVPHAGRQAQLVIVNARDEADRLVAYGTVTAQT